MIKADHKKWARFIFNKYIDRELKKNFSNFYLANEFPEINTEKPLLITPNHISWWDGFFIDFVARKFINRKFFLMMLEEQLSKYKFFSKLGAYSLVPDSTKSIIETSEYTKMNLKDSGNFVVAYPQGEIEDFDKRPLSIKEGLKLFIRGIDGTIFVIGFKIHFYNDKHPAIICRFGDCIENSVVNQDFEHYKDRFTENLDLLKRDAYKREFIKDLFVE